MPDKIMKTLTIGNTKYTIQDTRVDSLENELDDKLDAPASAGSNGQVLTLNSSGNPVWQSVPTELPSVSSSDNGKMLTVTNGAWAKGSIPTELPSVTTSDNGKILKVTSGAWAKGDVPTELPSVTSSDNNKILKVTNGAWAKGDAPSGLPSVTASDNGKMLTVANGVWAKGDIPTELPSVTASDNNNVLTVKNGSWTKGKVGWNQLESSVYQNISNHSSQIQSINDIIYRNIEPSDGSDDITYIKGTMSADGTINTAGNGIISSIIREPGYIWAGSDEGMCIALYDVNDTYIGKINENFEIDTDPSTGWYNSWDYNGNYPPENNNNIFGIRLLIFDITSATITNNSDAQTFGETTFGISYTNRATYKYVDSELGNKLDEKLDKPATAGTTGQVLSLNSSGDPVWQNASGGLPSVTSSDNGKLLRVRNGVWSKWQQGDTLPSESVNFNALNPELYQSINDFSQLKQYAIIEDVLDKTTFTKGTFNADGTLNLTGNGVITSIISSPWVINYLEGNTVIYMLAYNGDTCLGKFGWDGEQGTIDKDSSTDFYEFSGRSLVQETIQTSFQSYCPEAITGVRFCFCDPHNTGDMNITNNDDAYDWAMNYIDELTHIKLASYDYVDALKERIDKLESWTTPKQLQMICAAGLAPHYFNIGDIIYIEWTDRKPSTPVTYQYPFVVAHFGTVYDENDIAHDNAMYLMAMYATPRDYDLSSDPPVFDQSEAVVATGTFDTTNYDYYTYNSTSGYILASVTNGATIPSSPIYYKYYKSSRAICPKSPQNVVANGWNRYAYSAIRQWLNSDAPKGTNWWTPQHELDVAPSDVTLRPGWLDGFSQEWKEVFRPIRIKTWNYDFADTTYDKFFIPSVEQVYGVPVSGSTDEGEYWEYWKNVTELNQPSNGSSPQNLNAGRFIPPINHIEDATDNIIHLRSNPRGNKSYQNYMIYAGYGTFAGYIASFSCQTHATVLPTFVLF